MGIVTTKEIANFSTDLESVADEFLNFKKNNGYDVRVIHSTSGVTVISSKFLCLEAGKNGKK